MPSSKSKHPPSAAELRKKHAAEHRKEELIRICLEEHATGNTSFRDLSKKFGIPYQTLSGRFSGKKSALVSRERYMRFSLSEEKELEQVLLGCTHRGSALPRSLFYNVISMYLKEVKNANCENQSDQVTISRAWISGFLTRHPELQARVGAKPLTSMGQKAVDSWFHEFQTGVEDRNITPSNLYTARIRDGNTHSKPSYIRQGTYFTTGKPTPGPSEASTQLTLVEATCADGSALPPYLTAGNTDSFAALSHELQVRGLDWELTPEPSPLTMNWIQHYFDPLTRGKLASPDQWRGIVVEGDLRYMSFALLQYAIEHRIAFFFVPAGLASVLLPLTAGDAMLATPHSEAFLESLAKQGSWSLFVDSLSAFVQQQSHPDTVANTWQAVGLSPFNPSMVQLGAASPSTTKDHSTSSPRNVPRAPTSQPLPQDTPAARTALKSQMLELKDNLLQAPSDQQHVVLSYDSFMNLYSNLETVLDDPTVTPFDQQFDQQLDHFSSSMSSSSSTEPSPISMCGSVSPISFGSDPFFGEDPALSDFSSFGSLDEFYGFQTSFDPMSTAASFGGNTNSFSVYNSMYY